MQQRFEQLKQNLIKLYNKWWVKLPIAVFILIAIPLWPLSIGGIITYRVYKSKLHNKIKNPLSAILLAGTLLIGSFWLYAWYDDSPAPTPTAQPQIVNETLEAKKEKEEEEQVVQNIPEETPAEPVPEEPEINSETAVVSRVVDGDTIELQNGLKLRYIGIDTPESVHPNKPVECFAVEASNKNKELVEGKIVQLEKDVSETDQYGRLLRYVYIDGIFVNDYLVREGYAYASSYPPDIKYQNQLTNAQIEAREANRGLWGTCSEDLETQSSDTQATNTDTAPSNQGCAIKGNISYRTGEKIYHVPGQQYYEQTEIDESKGERWFCSEQDAITAGWRKSKR